jgi:hypothetical protein
MKTKKFRNSGTQVDLSEEYKRKVLKEVLQNSDCKSELVVADDASSFFMN